MEKVTLTEDAIYFAIDVWYEHDEIFTIIARGLVKTHMAKGLDIDTEFVTELIGLSRRWCSQEGEVA